MWDQFLVDMTILVILLIACSLVVGRSRRTRAVISTLFTGHGVATEHGRSRPAELPGEPRRGPGDRA